jgi:hypothetical protein
MRFLCTAMVHAEESHCSWAIPACRKRLGMRFDHYDWHELFIMISAWHLPSRPPGTILGALRVPPSQRACPNVLPACPIVARTMHAVVP